MAPTLAISLALLPLALAGHPEVALVLEVVYSGTASGSSTILLFTVIVPFLFGGMFATTNTFQEEWEVKLWSKWCCGVVGSI